MKIKLEINNLTPEALAAIMAIEQTVGPIFSKVEVEHCCSSVLFPSTKKAVDFILEILKTLSSFMP